jgi:hypothetical protein
LIPPYDAAFLAVRRHTIDHAIENVCGSIDRRLTISATAGRRRGSRL